MTATERELTVDELDVDDMVANMHYRVGGAWALLGANKGAALGRAIEHRDKIADLIPFLKALGRLALENPNRTRTLWAEALQEPMPFGGAPPGMPKVPLRPATEADWQAFGKEET